MIVVAIFISCRHANQQDKATVLEGLRSRLKIRGWTLRQLFGLESITCGDEVSVYEATKILTTELNVSGIDFTEAINKFVISHLLPGSKSHISFKSLLQEYEESFGITEHTYEVDKILSRIANKLITKKIDLKDFKQDDFSKEEIENIIKKDLDIFNQEPPKEENDEDTLIKKKLGILSKKDDEKEENKNQPVDKDGKKLTKWKPHEITEKEEIAVNDTIDYIMNGLEYVKLEEFTSLIGKYFYFCIYTIIADVYTHQLCMFHNESTLICLFSSSLTKTQTLNGRIIQAETICEEKAIQFA